MHACNHASYKHFLGASSVSGSGPRARIIARKGSRSSSVGIYISGFQFRHDCAIVFSHAPAKIWQCLETLLTVKSGSVPLPALNGRRPGMQPNIPSYNEQDSPHNKELSNPECRWCWSNGRYMSDLKGPWSEADTCVGFMGIQTDRVFHFSSKTNFFFLTLNHLYLLFQLLAKKKNLANNMSWFLRTPFIRASPN